MLRSNILRIWRVMQSGHERWVIRVSAGRHSCSRLLEGKVQQILPVDHHGYRCRSSDPQAHERVPGKNWLKDDLGNSKAFRSHVREKDFVLHAPAEVVPQPRTKK